MVASPSRLRIGRPRGARGTQSWSELVLDATQEGACGVDLDGIITFANPAAARLLGRPLNGVVGRLLHDLVHGESAADHRSSCPVAECLAAAAPHGTEDVFLRADGTSFPVDVSSTPVEEGGEHVGVVVTFRDASEHHRALDYYGQVVRLTAREAAQREVVHQLQEAVRPPMPTVAGVDLAVHYLPAEPAMPTGGDLYDWQVLPGGDLHLAVVDVLGKGVAATKDALTVVHALRLLVLEGWPLRRLVRRADELLRAHNPDLVATVLVARYSPPTGHLQLAGAGHPPALLVGHDGEVSELLAPGIAIGWPQAGSFDVKEVELERGDTLILYTDGLVEARRDIVRGLQDLREAAARTATYPVRHLPRILVERSLSGAERSDDTLALVLRRRVAPATAGEQVLGPFDHRFSAQLAAIPVARHLFGAWLAYQPIDESDREDMLVIASELCTNAVRAARGEVRPCALRAWRDGDAIVVEAEDDGAGFAGPTRGPDQVPEPRQTGGRGLFLVQSLVDEFELLAGSEGSGTLVRCRKRDVFPV